MLAVKVFPKKYELISSWLLRLTNNNGTNINVLSDFLFNNSKLILNDIDKSLENKDIQVLTEYINISSEIIEKLTLKNFLSNFSKEPLDSLNKWRWIIPSGTKYTIKTITSNTATIIIGIIIFFLFFFFFCFDIS